MTPGGETSTLFLGGPQQRCRNAAQTPSYIAKKSHSTVERIDYPQVCEQDQQISTGRILRERTNNDPSSLSASLPSSAQMLHAFAACYFIRR